MPDRKQTPDILGDLLGQRPAPGPKEPLPDAGKPASQDTGIPVRQHTGMPVKQQASRPARQRTGKPVSKESSEEERLKATYYLSPATLDALEEAWLQLRRMAGSGGRGRISKSAIVEAAILQAVQELEDKEGQSQLATRLKPK